VEAELAAVSARVQRLPTLAGYFALISGRRLVLIAVLGLVGAVVGMAYNSRAVPEYRASVYIALPDLPQWVDVNPDPPNAKRTTIDTSASLVFSDTVVEAIATQVGVSVEDARNSLSISARPLSRAAIVSFDSTSSDTAVAAANVAAEGMIEQRQSVLPGRRLDNLAGLSDQLISLRGTAMEFPFNTTSLPGQFNGLIARISELEQRHVEQRGHVVAAATSARKLPLHPELAVTTGLTLGVLAAICWCWLRGPSASRAGRASRRRGGRTPARSRSPEPLGHPR
jgi:hypothetical protein